jgi:hypothetical protein
MPDEEGTIFGAQSASFLYQPSNDFRYEFQKKMLHREMFGKRFVILMK